MSSSINGRPTYAAEYFEGDWNKSVFLDNPHTDNLMTALLGLGGEFWAMRRRMMVVEKLLADRGGIDASEIEAYQPDEDEQSLWDKERDDFIRRVFSSLVREISDVSGPIDTEGAKLRPPRNLKDLA
jgi:hypothetical protein